MASKMHFRALAYYYMIPYLSLPPFPTGTAQIEPVTPPGFQNDRQQHLHQAAGSQSAGWQQNLIETDLEGPEDSDLLPSRIHMLAQHV